MAIRNAFFPENQMETIQDSAERTITLGLGLNPEIRKVDLNLTF
jgi:hypothetical protein